MWLMLSKCCIMELNKTQKRILEAVERGYTITEEGILYGLKGVLSFKLYGKQRYPTFSTNWGGFVYGIPVHLFASYVFYSISSFEKGVVIRHLNANTLDCSKENLVLGTPSENENDKPEHVRIRSARIARASQGKRPLNAKLTDDQVEEIKVKHSLSYIKDCGGDATEDEINIVVSVLKNNIPFTIDEEGTDE